MLKMKIEDVQPGDLLYKMYSSKENAYILVKEATTEYLYVYFTLYELKTPPKKLYGTAEPFTKGFFQSGLVRLVARVKND